MLSIIWFPYFAWSASFPVAAPKPQLVLIRGGRV
jgi:hypothetical protein